MADCCTPGSGFPNAATMEQLATNYPVVWEEICMLQQAILAASSQCQPGGGQMCTTVGGNTPMTFVSGVSSVTVVNGGSNYFTDTPFAKIIPPLGGPGIGASASVVTNGSAILSFTMVSNGSGYQPIPATMNVSSVLGFGADLQPLVNGLGNIVGVNIVNAGSGYTVNDTVTASRAVAPNVAYVDAVFAITAVSLTGQIVSVQVLNAGSGYQPSVATVEIASTLNNSVAYPGGTGFIGTVLTDNAGGVVGISVDNGGNGYAPFKPYLVISDPGTGATTTVNLTGTSVSSIAVNNPGNNYTSSATGTVMNPPTAALPNPPATPAVVTINANQNTFGTNPTLYWQVWAGTTTNKPIAMQMNSVLAYFKGLGYTIMQQTNPATGSTIQWKICW
jgi:hypothetical protein